MKQKSNVRELKTWIEIDRRAVRNNVRAFRSILKKKTKLFAVVKSNAYGHGFELFSKLALDAGVDGFCVDSVIEGEKLRSVGVMLPILILGPTLPTLLLRAQKASVTISISNFEALTALLKSKQSVQFHLKVDTGMHRQGFFPSDIASVLKKIKTSKNLTKNFKGVFTHFAAAKDVAYPTVTKMQNEAFLRVKKTCIRAGFRSLLFHAAATGATALYPETHHDIVRIGIGLYGYLPTRETYIGLERVWGRQLHIQRVLTWRAVISECKKLNVGDYIGYDFSEQLDRNTLSVVLPVGYWHGYSRALSGQGEVLIGGVRGKVLGRVSMDLLSIGLPKGTRANVGDVATLIGSSGKEILDADSVALRAGTTCYELLTRINPLITRIIA